MQWTGGLTRSTPKATPGLSQLSSPNRHCPSWRREECRRKQGVKSQRRRSEERVVSCVLSSYSCTKEKEKKAEREPRTKLGFRLSGLLNKKTKGETERETGLEINDRKWVEGLHPFGSWSHHWWHCCTHDAVRTENFQHKSPDEPLIIPRVWRNRIITKPSFCYSSRRKRNSVNRWLTRAPVLPM